MMTADSSVWIDFFRGRDTPQVQSLSMVLRDNDAQIIMLDLVLMEVLRGFIHDHEWRLAREAFADLPVATAGGEAVALHAAAIYRQLRQRGITVRSAIDLLVGAWCIEHEVPLLHADRDFDGMAAHHGLPVFPSLISGAAP